MTETPEPQTPQPSAGAITIDSRLAWGLASAIGIVVGSLGTWATAGPFSVAGTAGSGDGWITLAVGVVLGALVALRRVPWLVLPGAILAGGIGIGDAIRLGDSGNEWFSVSIGWGLVLVIVASASLATWAASVLSVARGRQRMVTGVVTVLALAVVVAIGVADRSDEGSSDQASTAETANAERSESREGTGETSVADDSGHDADKAPGEDEPTFENGLLTTSDVKMRITQHKVIEVGQKGNEYGEKPVIAFWYETTNLSGAKVDPMMAFILSVDAYQDNDPNAENKLEVALLPDDRFLESQGENIKKGGTVENAVAYELDDLKTPVDLVATHGLDEVIGKVTYDLR